MSYAPSILLQWVNLVIDLTSLWSSIKKLFLRKSGYLDIGQIDRHERPGKPGPVLLTEHILI